MMMDAGTKLVVAGNADRVVRQRPRLFLPHCGELGRKCSQLGATSDNAVVTKSNVLGRALHFC